MHKVARVPTPLTHDPEDVAWALTTAEAMWNRGDRHDAVKWVRRAADAARDAKATERAAELVRAGQELATIAEQSPSISRLDVVPRSRPPSFVPTHHPEVDEVPIPAPPIVPSPIVRIDERKSEKFLEETRPAPAVAEQASEEPPPVRAAQPTVVVDAPGLTVSPSAAPTRLPETTPPPPVAARETPAAPRSEAPVAASSPPPPPNATAQWSVAEALARVAAITHAPLPSTPDPASPDDAPALAAVPDLSEVGAPDPLETTTEVRAMLRNAALAETVSRDAEPATVEPTTGEHRSVVPPRAPSSAPRADARAARPALRTSQAVHVVLWQDAQGVHVAPSGTVVSAIAIEALIVPLDPNADLSAWLLPGGDR